MVDYPAMISGPDLGGGCLHQLTRARSGNGVVYVFHAQPGGADAQGPPVGPLEPLGWTRPQQACQFGGTGCWHREFVLPEADDGRVRVAYQRTRSVLAVELAQVHRGPPSDGEPALREVLRLLDADARIPTGGWWVGGRWSARLQGVVWPATTVELGCESSAVEGIADALSDYLTEPPSRTPWPGRGEVSGGRAFVGTFVRGTRVEWSSRSPAPPGPVNLEWSGDGPAESRSVAWEGRPVRVSRLEYSLGWTLVHGEKQDQDRVVTASQGEVVDIGLLREVLIAAGHPETTLEQRLEELRTGNRRSPATGSGPSASS